MQQDGEDGTHGNERRVIVVGELGKHNGPISVTP